MQPGSGTDPLSRPPPCRQPGWRPQLAAARARGTGPYGPTPGPSGICFGILADLIGPLEEARAAGRLRQRLETLTHPAPLAADGIGHLSVTPNGTKPFAQLVDARYGHASTVPTYSKGFWHWGKILHDEVMAAALPDRLLHRCRTVSIRGHSYRMRRDAEVSKAIRPAGSRTK